ncbi:MAG: DUF1992 domain-containing protein [Candidatus Melainabacteria bacterium HGW-Melainabacteria-1]|nr:MAG: DUF1992 domain-containing protein [Candidatus Melainabacteria bacterium HGW-Melainabacteria-1]
MFEHTIEQKIREAQSRGEFENLPGSGQPLQFEDQSDVPPESRMAYRLLKNAGYVPEDIQLRKDLYALQALIEETPLTEIDSRRRLLAQLDQDRARYYTALERSRRRPD